jgi:hypothetical protein
MAGDDIAEAAGLQVGVDVPWVTAWSEETVTGPAPCPSVDGVLALQQLDRQGQGQPDFSRNHLFRQRKSVREMLCPMCGEPTENGDRWTQTGRWATAGEFRAHGLGPWLPRGLADDRPLLGLGAVAPLHRACAERALAQCPHLAGLADRTLKPFPAAWVVAPLSVAPKMGQVGAPPVVTFLSLIGVPDEDDA